MDSRIIDRLIDFKADGLKSIYYVNAGGLELIFRPLTFNEYDTITDLERYLDGASINDTIVRMTVLYCTRQDDKLDWVDNFPRAHLIDHLAQAILDISGFQNKNRFFAILEEKRHVARQVQSLFEIYICSVFKTISPNDVREMNMEQQAEYFAKAEEALGKPIDFKVLLGDDKVDKNKLYPTPAGMESTDILGADVANNPWEDIKSGRID